MVHKTKLLKTVKLRMLVLNLIPLLIQKELSPIINYKLDFPHLWCRTEPIVKIWNVNISHINSYDSAWASFLSFFSTVVVSSQTVVLISRGQGRMNGKQ